MRRRAQRGFTLIELLVVIGVIGVLMTMILAVQGTVLRKSKRAACASNLRQIGIAVTAYMNGAFGPNHRKGFGPHVRDLQTPDEPEDVGIVFQTLVRTGEIDDPEVFICPASFDVPLRLGQGQQLNSYTLPITDVTDPDANFSYGWTAGTIQATTAVSTIPIAADRTVTDIDQVGTATTDVAINHIEGRNLLRLNGTVEFVLRELEDTASPLNDPTVTAFFQNMNLLRDAGLTPPGP